MTTLPNPKNAQHLMHLIVTRNGEVPNFALLLGSGSSATSGVRTALSMIEEWRGQLYSRSKAKENYQEWLEDQGWYGHDDEYSMLFEQVFDQPSQRRVFVEECVKAGRPGWGYVYLTNLLHNRYFDVVFTTNFDDLLNEACYLYSEGLRPIVAAHDSAVQGIRVSSGRPKIIKLHGDFLYDNIKNTLSELESLEANTKRKLKQFAQEYGLVVLGYSGRDKSVMETLDLLLRDEENYKQGIYWCIRRGAIISNRLKDLLRRDRIYLVEIDGFDEFTAELNEAAQLPLPKSIARPLDMARDRARLFVEVEASLKSHPVISAHVEKVLISINTDSPTLPLPMEAARLSARGEYLKALAIWQEAIEEDPTDESVAFLYADALADAEQHEELAKFVLESPLQFPNKTYLLLRAGANQEAVDLATSILSNHYSDKWGLMEDKVMSRINRAIAFKRLGRVEEMQVDIDFLEGNGHTDIPNIRAGVAALRGDREGMFEALDEALNKTILPQQLKVFPVFEDYRGDPEFMKLFSEGELPI